MVTTGDCMVCLCVCGREFLSARPLLRMTEPKGLLARPNCWDISLSWGLTLFDSSIMEVNQMVWQSAPNPMLMMQLGVRIFGLAP